MDRVLQTSFYANRCRALFRYHDILSAHLRSLGQEPSEYKFPSTFKELGISSSLALYINDVDS